MAAVIGTQRATELDVKESRSHEPADKSKTDVEQRVIEAFNRIVMINLELGQVDFSRQEPITWATFNRYQDEFTKLRDAFEEPSFLPAGARRSRASGEVFYFKSYCTHEITTIIAKIEFVRKQIAALQDCSSERIGFHYLGINLHLEKLVFHVNHFVKNNLFLNCWGASKELVPLRKELNPSHLQRQPKDTAALIKLLEQVIEKESLNELETMIEANFTKMGDCVAQSNLFAATVRKFCVLPRLREVHYDILNLLLCVGFDLRGIEKKRSIFAELVLCCTSHGSEKTAIELAQFLLEKGFSPNEFAPFSLAMHMKDFYQFERRNPEKLPRELIQFLLDNGLDMGFGLNYKDPTVHVRSTFYLSEGADLACLYAAAGLIDTEVATEQSKKKFLDELSENRVAYDKDFTKAQNKRDIEKLSEVIHQRKIQLSLRKAVGTTFGETAPLYCKSDVQIVGDIWRELGDWEANRKQEKDGF